MEVVPDDRPHTCPQCVHKPFRRATSLAKHIRRRHSGECRHACDVPGCHARFARRSLLREHRTTTHEEAKKARRPNPRLVCPECGKVTLKEANMTLHMAQHRGEKPFKCPQCEFRTDSRSYIRRHELTHAGGDPRFQCNKCDYRALDATGLKVHQRGKHSGEKPFKCTQCDFATAYRTYLKTHLNLHKGVKMYECACGFSTAVNSNLHAHVKSQHPDGVAAVVK